MKLDRNRTDKGYLQGRLLALIENIIGKENISAEQSRKACTEPLNILSFLLKQARKRTKKEQSEEMEAVAEKIGTFENLSPVQQGQFWIGYYHQQRACEKDIS